jgi:hypothetical protein
MVDRQLLSAASLSVGLGAAIYYDLKVTKEKDLFMRTFEEFLVASGVSWVVFSTGYTLASFF